MSVGAALQAGRRVIAKWYTSQGNMKWKYQLSRL